MKKGEMIISALALVVAIGGAYAFKVRNTVPGDLYYYNVADECVMAPCEKVNNTGYPCELQTYVDDVCTEKYTERAWVTVGGK